MISRPRNWQHTPPSAWQVSIICDGGGEKDGGLTSSDGRNTGHVIACYLKISDDVHEVVGWLDGSQGERALFLTYVI